MGLRKVCGLSDEVMGSRKGNFRLAGRALVVVAAAIICSSLAQLPIFRYDVLVPVGLNITWAPIDLILVPTLYRWICSYHSGAGQRGNNDEGFCVSNIHEEGFGRRFRHYHTGFVF